MSSQQSNINQSPSESLPTQQNSLQKEIKTLNQDKFVFPKRLPFSFHLELFLLSAFQIAAAWFLYDMYCSYVGTTGNQSNADIDDWHGQIYVPPTNPTLDFNSTNTNQTLDPTKTINQGSIDILSFLIVSVIYLVLGIASYMISSIRTHFQSASHISQFNQTFQKMKKSKLKLEFTIECYHEEQTHDTNGSKSTRKVVTHTANKEIKFSQLYDFSGNISNDFVNQIKKPYVFIDYKPEYEMIHPQEKDILQKMYLNFINENKRDQKQNSNRTYGFEHMDVKTAQAYLMDEGQTKIGDLMLGLSLLMLSWPFSLVFDYFYVEKYEVTILKKVKMDQNQGGYQG